MKKNTLTRLTIVKTRVVSMQLLSLIMRIVLHTSEATIYSSHVVNFYKILAFFCSGSIPRGACSTPYFVLVKRV